MNSHHLKMQESINYRLFLLLWSIWRPAVLTLCQIIILPFDDTALPLCFRDIQVCYMKSVLLLYPRLDLLKCSALLKPGHVHVFEREFHSDILTRYVSLGKLYNRLDLCYPNHKRVEMGSFFYLFSFSLIHVTLCLSQEVGMCAQQINKK